MANIVVYPYLSPRLVEVLAPDTEITIQELVDLIRDWEDDDRNMSMSFDSLISAAGKEDLEGGVFVGITATLENAQVFFTPRSTPRDDGTGRTCDATDLNGRQLYVDDATFVSDGVVRGDLVYNKTTKGSATILEVVDENTINHLELSGGSNDDWTSGDEYIVFEVVQCNISGGNLVAKDDMGATIPPALQTFGTQIVRTSSSSATLTETQELRELTFDGAVWIDYTSGDTGTEYPLGNKANPVNNDADALTIASFWGIKEFHVKNGTFVATQDFMSYSFTGGGLASIDFGGFDLNGSIFNNIDIINTDLSGLTGPITCIDLKLEDVTDFWGTAQRCTLSGTISLSGPIAEFLYCSSGVAGTSTVIIDLQGNLVSGYLRNYNGGVEYRNMTNILSNWSSDINSGHVIFSASNTSGVFVLRGIGHQTNSGATSTIVDTGFISQDILSADFWNEIVDGTYTAREILQILVAVGAGKTDIEETGENEATVRFRNLNDTIDVIEAELEGSERKNITLTTV